MPAYNMAQILKPGREGSAELQISLVEKPVLTVDGFVPPGEYARLLINGKVIMTDTPMEYESNAEFIQNCYGDVFVAGLGMGMILLEVQDKPEVKTITVLEKNNDVIRLVKPQLPLNEKVRVICGDAFTYTPRYQYDYIYLDIWYESSADIYLTEMLPLMERYLPRLKPGTKPFPRIAAWGKSEGDKMIELLNKT